MTITHDRWIYCDAYGVPIAAQSWVPKSPRAAIQMLHGIGEHSGRYEPFAKKLAQHDFAVFAEDHRGHGRTALEQWAGDRSKFGYLGRGGLRATEQAITQLTSHIRKMLPGVRVGAFAHSWGSLMAQRIMNRERVWDAVVLSGSAYRLPKYMETGDVNVRFPGPTGHEWLSRDESVAVDYVNDPLTYESNIRRQFGTRDSLRLFGVPGRRVAHDVPILIASGGDDALNKADGLERLAAAYRRVGVLDVTLKVYPGARHELLRETNANEVMSDLFRWFDSRL